MVDKSRNVGSGNPITLESNAVIMFIVRTKQPGKKGVTVSFVIKKKRLLPKMDNYVIVNLSHLVPPFELGTLCHCELIRLFLG